MNNTLVKKKKSTVKKVITHHYLRILSRHPSISPLRNSLLIKGIKAVYRHGSTTKSEITHEINSVDSVKISADKLRMKEAFDKAKISHAIWISLSKPKEEINKFLESIKFPDCSIIIKHRFGSRGTGNYFIEKKEDFDNFLKNHAANLNDYIAEEYKNYSVEYRIHVSINGAFYACRKMLKSDTPENERFQRHDDNCVWYIESNPKFNKPSNWDDIVNDCKKALNAIGADVLAFDIKCTSTKEKKDKNCKWIVIESCSAPSFGNVTLEKYEDELPRIIRTKYLKNENN